MTMFIVTTFKNLYLKPPQLTTTKEIPAIFVNSNSASTSSSGTLPSNKIANLRSDLKATTTRSGVSYDGPQIPPSPSFLPKVVEDEPEATKDTVNPTNKGTLKTSNLIWSISASKTNPKTSIPYPSRRNDERNYEKAKNQIEKFYQIFKDMSFKISFADALILMPKYVSTLKALIGNKEKLSEMARTPLNEHCSVGLLKKLPEKLGDPCKFLIPCDFPSMAECLALADLGASINSMPFSIWKRLSLPDLTPTCMTLELADHSISRPVGVAEDVYVKGGKFELGKVGKGRGNSVEWWGSAGIGGSGLLRCGGKTDPSKIEAVKNWKALITLSEDKLCDAPILALPDGPEDFVVYCDASSLELGCVLMQKGSVIPRLCELRMERKGVVHFGKKGKLAPRFVGPFEIIKKVGPVTYRLDFLEELNGVHDTFHVSNHKKCLADPTLQVPLDEIRVNSKLNFMEKPVEILEQEFKKLKRSIINIVKVWWNSKRRPESMWESEDQMKLKYLHLFSADK
nr:reverse transcriptase domain-containing protein [Tanacetum cinerariifolium]